MVAAGSITVAVRVRPPSSWEAARLPVPCYDTTIRGDGALSTLGRSVTTTSTLRDIVQIVDDRILTFDPDEKDRAKAFVERGFMPPGTKRYKDKRFMFDRVFNHEARQQDVYESTSQPLLKGLFDGYNATVFAYGATGCGKTHTISGTESDPGIIYLTMADLFQRIEDRKDEYNVEVMVTFLEIYNEEIRDLLAESGTTPRGGLSIREDKSVKVAGLVELRPQSAEEVKDIVILGNSRRTQSPTHANETSSRSHAVLHVHVTQSPRTASVTEQRTMATLSIIDLAGSERAAATSNMGQRMVEGANINKSLLALGNCINALCESGGATRHIPYRNSKLTRLLKFSLGGNCKTVMIVCVAPTSNHFDDTHNTLLYAERATKIKTKVVTRNVVNVDRHVGRYVEAINRLNIEVAELKAKLAGRVNIESDIVRRKRAEATAEVERVKHDMKVKVEQTKASIVDGASCMGKLGVAKAKLAVIRTRLQQIDAYASSSSGGLSADLEAERALLQALAGPEEQAIRPESALNVRLQRSNNSLAMFEATLRAVSERRSEKLDEVDVDNVKLDAKCRKAEMERTKAEEERDVIKSAVENMAEVVVGLIGMLGRCTVMVGEAGRKLGGPLDTDGGDGIEEVVGRVAKSLRNVKEKNDEAFMKLVGHSTEGYAMDDKSLASFNGYPAAFSRRISSDPMVLQQANAKQSLYGSIGAGRPSYTGRASTSGSSPGRKSYRSPRKSLRSSLAGQPYRRVSDKEREKKNAKSVQWKDEAGQGNLDDGGSKLAALASTSASVPVAVTITPADVSGSTPTLVRAMSLGGSESEWEDENEKTDDSVGMSFMSMSLPPSARDSSFSFPTSSRPFGTVGAKRPRASRLDPHFLKSKSGRSVLGSLAEDDESGSPIRRAHAYGHPLGDRNLNHLPTPDDSGSGSGSISDGQSTSNSNSLHIPKGRDRHVHGSPARRGPSTPRVAGMGKSASGTGRRRSNIGPIRNEKGRRRSSLIPQLSPPNGDSKGGARRVLQGDRSPAKRAKRMSLLGSGNTSTSISRSNPTRMALNNAASGSTSMANLSIPTGTSPMDPNTSGDISFNKSFRPTWR